MADNDRFRLEALLRKQRKEPCPSVATRKQMLLALKSMLINHEEAFMQALFADMGRPAFETFSFEIAVLLNEIDHVCKHLGKWMKPARTHHLKFGYVERIRKVRNPYGCVLVISPWNYPLQLALMPAISAIAAGNHCIIKPSEYAPATSERLQEAIRQTFPPEQMTVVTGDAQTSKLLTALPFDLIFFTGGQQTGKAVAQQAAQQLTPAVLELGGKNPCLIDESGFSTTAIEEIVWGKFLNAGQTCIAPDTVFVPASIYEQTLSAISTALSAFYGDRPEDSDDYARICHHAHFQKLVDFIGQGDVWHGGDYREEDLYMAPTVVTNIKAESAIMREEIFGPVLPVVPYTDLEALFAQQAIQRDALTGYIFSQNKQHIRAFHQYIQSTSVSVNQVIHHAANPHVAFGGIGRSGQGSYHGHAGFLACSYHRTDYSAYHYMHVPDKFPPYTDKDMNVVKKFRKWLL